MALTLIRPTNMIRCGSNRVPDGACAYPAYEYVSVWLKPHAGWRFAYPAYEGDSVWLKPRAGWRLRLSGLQVRCY